LAAEDPDLWSNGVRKLKNPFVKRHPENRKNPTDITIAAISEPAEEWEQQKDVGVGSEDRNKIEEVERRRKWITDEVEYEARLMTGWDYGMRAPYGYRE